MRPWQLSNVSCKGYSKAYRRVPNLHIFECTKSSLSARFDAAKSLNEMFEEKGRLSFGEAMP